VKLLAVCSLFGNHMKARLFLFSAFSLVLIICSCNRDPETLVRDGYDEQEMETAIARARAEIDVFIAALEKGQGSDFAIKVPITDRGETEHFWLTDVTYRDDAFEGLIGNDPGIVTNVKFGQKWKSKKSEISDWLFMRDKKMHGNYTLRPLLKTMKKEEAQMWRSRFAEP
jgi:uncharacterized protein YegJ (DUF2314 family)